MTRVTDARARQRAAVSSRESAHGFGGGETPNLGGLWPRTAHAHKVAPSVNTLAESLLLTLRASGRQPGTIEWYADRLERFARAVPKSAAAVTADDVRRFLVTVKAGTEGQTSDGYVEGYRKAIARLFAHAVREGLLPRSPMGSVAKFRIEHREPSVLTPLEVSRLIATQPMTTVTGIRNRTMIAFLYDTGVRVGELVGIRVVDLDLAAGTCRVRGKTGEGVVPLSIALRRMLLQYVQRARPRMLPFVDSGVLFLGRNGEPLNETAVNQWLRRAARAAGIVGKRVSPHTFRHSFATQYLRNGGDAFTLQRILRHRTSDMVRRYVHVAASDVEERHAAASPLERLTRIG